LRWSIVGTGEEIASIGFEARLGEKDGYVRLHWTSTNRWSGEKRQCENRIELATRAQPLGGRRWWFVCPHTGQLAERLHLPSGAYIFACRKAYRLAYRSQRETPRDRALSVRIKIERRERFTDIGPDNNALSRSSTSASISPADTRNPSPAKSGAET
jgi:hypothetical protein